MLKASFGGFREYLSPSLMNFLDQGCCCIGASATLPSHAIFILEILDFITVVYSVDVTHLGKHSLP